MHPYNRIPSSGQSTPSPPPSPLRSPASAAPSRGGLPLASSPVGPSPNVLLGSSYRYSSVARGFSSSLPSSTSPACCFTWVPSPSTSFPSSSTARLPALSTGARRFTPSSAPKWILIIRPAIRSVLGPILISTVWKHSYKSGEWQPCVNRSSGGMNYVLEGLDQIQLFLEVLC
ncbi:hypothetical protein CK203_070618 [Vitis vinifera]|uniref:Uncharacterized protein n=1 Tax=Vitis vinifera TaxID=29760 RepID=A0A438C137_VITVI|nr:hypothetical protein CK203_070618 [Vitis vinifera]